MKIFALMCSHRKKKNTEHVLDYFLDGFSGEHQIVKKRLVDQNIKVCIACEYCKKNLGKCIHDDDMNEIIQDMLGSDLIVIASPLYFNSVTSLYKIMIDRTQTLYNAWYHLKEPLFKSKKPVVFLSVGGSRSYKNQFQGIIVETEHFLTNINGKVLDFIKYNNSDRVSLINNEEAKMELIAKAKTIEEMVIDNSWQ
ncbi:hypothetical protein GC105_06205 [Alkalibaculum sp. M08DMB]|uniref:NADPH-dependent FMN reductase-like domain-containing protein n=1 Tax=Alkalibaculum sporogenes TaxID=2655001 RepID=A0A6A7K7K1_9FIRM|nr:flavodoxin family protein [Alkalibaculum sporogenes]MPW25376.1 hypothetical protein [Alkalibaculum sporogenes]